MPEPDRDLGPIRRAAAGGRVSDELWHVAWHAAVVARTLLPATATASRDDPGPPALAAQAPRLLVLALSAADVSMLRDRLLGYELHALLAERRDAVGAAVVRRIAGNGAGRSTTTSPRHDVEALGEWPVLGDGSLCETAVARALEDTSRDAPFHEVAQIVMQRLLVEVPASIDELLAADATGWSPVQEPALSRTLALLAPAEAGAGADSLRPWAAMLAGSAQAGAGAATRAAALCTPPARGELIDELFATVDAGQPPPAPRSSLRVERASAARPRPGDLMLTVARPVAGLVLLLPFEAARDDAVIVAPVDFHRHVAGAMDLVLAPADSGIDCDLRVALGLEAPVDLADLEFRLASVEPGLVRRIANATVPEDRYGTSPAARQDPWLQLDEPLRSALADLEHSAGARHPLSELWGTFAEVWDPNHVPELVDLFRALPADPSDAVVDLAEVIARRRLHEAARDIAFGRGAVAAGKLRDVTRPAWPVTHDSVPGLAARLEESGSGSLLIVEGLPSDLGGQRVLIVLAQGYRRDCDWWNGLEGVLAPDAEVAGGRVEVVLAKGALRTRDLAGLAVVPAPP